MEYIILVLLLIYMASWLVCHVYALKLAIKGEGYEQVLYYVAAGIAPVIGTKVAVCDILTNYCKNLKRL